LSEDQVQALWDHSCVKFPQLIPSSDSSVQLKSKIGYYLQGRYRLFFNFLCEVLSSECSDIDSVLERYVSSLVLPGKPEQWTLFLQWEKLISYPVLHRTISLASKNSGHVPLHLAIELLLEVGLNSESPYGSTSKEFMSLPRKIFSLPRLNRLSDSDLDLVSLGLCPLLKDKFVCIEPLVFLSGVNFLRLRDDFRIEFFKELNRRLFSSELTPQQRGSYWDFFVGLRFSLDFKFRENLFNRAKSLATDSSHAWILSAKLPSDPFFPFYPAVPDDYFISYLKNRGHDSFEVIQPGFSAGPDLVWWIFVVGNKTSWTRDEVSEKESRRNSETVDLRFSFLGCKRASDESSLDEECPSPKRQLELNNRVRSVLDHWKSEKQGFVRVRFELPDSFFFGGLDFEHILRSGPKSPHDIELKLTAEDCQKLFEFPAEMMKLLQS